MIEHRLLSLATARQGMSLEASYRVRLRGEASAGELVKALNRIEGVQSVELAAGVGRERRVMNAGSLRTREDGYHDGHFSRVAGAALLALAAAVQMSGGTAAGVTAAAQGFPGGGPPRGGGFGGRFGGVRAPLALVDKFDADKNKRLNSSERHAALEYLRTQGSGHAAGAVAGVSLGSNWARPSPGRACPVRT